MSDRFYIDPSVSVQNGDRVTLCGDEAYHFCRVMRGRVGDEIFLFDGVGGLFFGVVECVFKDKVEVFLTTRIVDQTECPLKLTIASALPKGDRQKFLVEKLAEIGVRRFVPIQLERSVARADAGVISRFKRYVIEAAKQCGRNVLMEIAEEITLDNLIKTTKNCKDGNNVAQNNVDCGGGNVEGDGKNDSGQQDFLRLLLHPVSLGKVGQITPKQLLNNKLPNNVIALIGPEGSFTDREVSVCIESGFVPFAIGARILRTETACITVAALLLPYAG
ncbi:MAG: 16S rRNA (uracil(1498)-N(3))-methyltransferase [Planctomycetaceae bacterium]|jgi:16S rRNA (uracil1498-N3)-methyltransferase|nr:16S rRNA (uracil(1498)-N(3))-methyltransferase [Planctomycetaceae bacterium]